MTTHTQQKVRAFRNLITPTFATAIFWVWTTYLLTGNFSRVGEISKSGGIPLVEPALFFLVLGGYFLLKVPITIFILGFALTVAISWVFGFIANSSLSFGEHIAALAYAARLVALVFSANFIGWALSRWLTPINILVLFRVLLLAQVCIGILIYVAFPSASDLWRFMERLGLEFNGDPHQRRLLGPPLDPNYFGNILILGVLISICLIFSGSIKFRLFAAFQVLAFMGAIALTISRSSFLGLTLALLLMVGIFGVTSLPTRFQGQWLRLVGLLFLIAVIASGIAAVALPQEIARLAERIVGVGSDSSAVERLTSATDGLSFLLEPQTLIFGVGYNYIPTVAEGYQIVTSFYSSIINTWVAFGIPLSVVLSLLIIASMVAFTRKLLISHPLVFSALWAYLLSSIVMSLFNNLLYYPLYLLTFLPLLLYFYWEGRARQGS